MPRPTPQLIRLVQDRSFRVDRHEPLLRSDRGLLEWELDERDLVDEAEYERVRGLVALVELQLYWRYVARSEEERREAALAFRDVCNLADYRRYEQLLPPGTRLVERDGRWTLETESEEQAWERLHPFLEELWEGLSVRKHRPFHVQRDYVRRIARRHGVHPAIAYRHVWGDTEARSEAV